MSGELVSDRFGHGFNDQPEGVVQRRRIGHFVSTAYRICPNSGCDRHYRSPRPHCNSNHKEFSQCLLPRTQCHARYSLGALVAWAHRDSMQRLPGELPFYALLSRAGTLTPSPHSQRMWFTWRKSSDSQKWLPDGLARTSSHFGQNSSQVFGTAIATRRMASISFNAALFRGRLCQAGFDRCSGILSALVR